jgi:O-antigen/teichoic acid export membrane protein
MSDLTNKLIRSSALLILTRLIQRSLGLVSTLILARILTPDDFGLIAIVSVLIYLTDSISNAGSPQYIIRKTELLVDDLDTAWSVNIVMKIAMWVVIVSLAGVASDFYNKAELETAIYVSSLVLLIGVMKSPKIILYQRELNYKPIFKLSVIQKISSFFAVMIVIYVEPSYWALIIGDLVSICVLTIGSYLFAPYRPKFTLKKIKEQWAFSQWIFLKSGLGFVKAESDNLLVTKFYSVIDVSSYYLMRGLSILPITEIIKPALEPLVASFSKLRDNKVLLYAQFVQIVLILTALILPISVFTVFNSEQIVHVLLGQQWVEYHKTLAVFALAMVPIVMIQLLNQYCIAIGKVRSLFIFDLFSLVLTFFILFFSIGIEVEYFALIRSSIIFILMAVLFVYVKTCTPISFLHMFLLISPVIIIVLVAAQTKMTFEFQFVLLELTLNFILYITTIVVIYLLSYKIYLKRYVEYQILAVYQIKILNNIKAKYYSK